ncbi:NACHT domain-containing protein [Streptomyces sp. NBC_00029]|uniref:NACHT domain-containing protein n=1 Tax=Streptomyces sp. NBC_00029 TaxID=2903613 RepID=UPI00324E1227
MGGWRFKQTVIILGVGAMLALAGYYALHTLQENDQMASVVASFVGVIALVLALLQYRQQGVQLPSALDSSQVADVLAVRVASQWDEEWRVRELERPYLLPVAWQEVEGDLVEDWGRLASIATGWPGGPPGEPSQWPAAATSLCGVDGEIGDIFLRRVPTRRLVVLGEPGAGKSVLLTRLQGELLSERANGGRVPVVFPLASWDVSRQTFRAWMTEQLVQDHGPALLSASVSVVGRREMNSRARIHAEKLIDEKRILPLLDGFDELPRSLQPRALAGINDLLPSQWPLVLTSRTAEYREALRSEREVTGPLLAAGGIRLIPLTRQIAMEYLRSDAGAAHARWDEVDSVPAGSPVTQALATPLGVFLAKTVFNPRTGEPLNAVPHPRSMLDHTSREDLLAFLFRSFLPAAYRSDPQRPCRWTRERVERTLRFLAGHLERTPNDDQLRWWQLRRLYPHMAVRSLVGALAGLLAGGTVFVGSLLLTGIGFALYFFVTTLAIPGEQEIGRVTWAAFRYTAKVSDLLAVSKAMNWGVLTAVITAVTGWITTRRWEDDLPAVGVRWSWQQLRLDGLGLVFLAMAAGAVVTSGVMAAISDEPAAWFSDTAVIAVLIVPLVAASALVPRPVAPDQAAGPASLVTLHRRTLRATVLRIGLATAVVTGLLVGVSVGAAEGYPLSILFGVFSALAVGAIAGLTTGLASTSWAPYAAATSLLALRGHVPWHLQAFLADAHRRGVLRQAGTAYQFRHRELQRHLAGRS